MQHRQASEVQEALSRYQVVCYIGARGTGKTLLADNVAEHLRSSAVSVVRLRAQDLGSPADVIDPMASAAGLSPTALRDGAIPEDARVRVIIDDAHEFHRHRWFHREQEEWRAVLSQERARGRIALLLLGRPLFRTLAGGAGSPLLNIGTTIAARPLDTSDEMETVVDQAAFNAHARKTGGHPHLTEALLRLTGGDVEQLREAVPQLVAEHRRYILRLSEDHALASRGVLWDLLEAAGQPVSSSALIARHFGESASLGFDCLADLAGTGLITQGQESCSLAAELLKAMPEVRMFLRAPAAVFPASSTADHAQAARELFRLENELRAAVAAELEAVDSTWWPSRIPEGVVAEVELRRRAESESSASADPDAHPLLFLTTGELVDLVLTRASWDGSFRVRFNVTREAFERAMGDVIAVRNKVAHNREVSSTDVALLRSAGERLGLGRSG